MVTSEELSLAVRSVALAAERYRARVGGQLLRMSPTELAAMGQLKVEGPQTPSQLALHLMITSASTTEVVDRLQQAGHVQRGPHPTDRRKVLVSLTPAGLATMTDAQERYLSTLSEVTEPLSAAERDVVLQFLRATAEALAGALTQPQRLPRPRPAAEPSSPASILAEASGDPPEDRR